METFLTIVFALCASIAVLMWLFIIIFIPNKQDEVLNQKLQEKKMASLIKGLTQKN